MRHTLYWERDDETGTPPAIGEVVEVSGEEAMHATKSKRLREGDVCRVCDGAGVVLACVVEGANKSRVVLRVERAAVAPPVRPMLEICSATPKGQRLDKMLDMLAQCGAAMWRPLTTSRGVVEPGAHKLERGHRISVEALKQCGRAHLMTIGDEIDFADALAFDGDVVLADATGDAPNTTDAERVRVLIGPEGGFTPEEMAMARDTGAKVVRLGAHVLRIETAAVLAAGALMRGASGA